MLCVNFKFRNRTINNVNYDSRFSFENGPSFQKMLIIFFGCNPDPSTPEQSSLLYDLIIEYFSHCNNLIEKYNTTNSSVFSDFLKIELKKNNSKMKNRFKMNH
jgi:hypothetical protein